MKRWLTGTLICGVAALAAASPAEPDGVEEFEIKAGTPWSQPYFTQFDVEFPGNDFHARWEIHRCPCGDVLIRSEETLPEGISIGEQILVGGRMVLTRGFDGYQGDPRAQLDSPMLMLQLLFVLMQKLEHSGPAGVNEPVNIQETEPRLAIELDTGVAYGSFPAPWQLKGEAHRTENGSHSFDLQFGFEARYEGQPAGQAQIHLSGVLDYQPVAFPMPDGMSLEGWTISDLRSEALDDLTESTLASLVALRERVRKAKAGE